MGKSRTLVYQIGRYYKMTNTNSIHDSNWLVVKTEDYQKKDKTQGQRVFFENVSNGKTLEREQQYR